MAASNLGSLGRAVTYRRVLVMSPETNYLDDVSVVLTELGVKGVLTQDGNGAAEALHDGFLPEVVLLDPALAGRPDVEQLILLLRRTPTLAAVPVIVLAGRWSGEATENGRDVTARTVVVTALQKLGEDPAPSP